MVPTLFQLAQSTFIRDLLFLSDKRWQDHYLFPLLGLSVEEKIIAELCKLSPKRSLKWTILGSFYNELSTLSLSQRDLTAFAKEDLRKIFTRCHKLKKFSLEYVKLPHFFESLFLFPTVEHLNNLSLSCCLNLRDADVNIILEICINLETLDLSGNQLSDTAFTGFKPKKVLCQCCGNKGNTPLKLRDLDLAGCDISTRSIRRIVELCGRTLRSLNLSQCFNVYTTSLWYLCGLFTGKERLLDSDFSTCCPQSCCCFIRSNHTEDITCTSNEVTNGIGTDCVALNDIRIIDKESNRNENIDNICNNTPELNVSVGENQELSSKQEDALPFSELTCNTIKLCADFHKFLQTFMFHTKTAENDSDDPLEENIAVDNTPILENHKNPCSSSFVDTWEETLTMHFHSLLDDIHSSKYYLVTIIEQRYDDISIEPHILFKNSSKSISVTIKQVIQILDTQTALWPDHRNSLKHLLAVLAEVRHEIQQNELLRLKLLHSLELESIQREELSKLQNLHDRLNSLNVDRDHLAERIHLELQQGDILDHQGEPSGVNEAGLEHEAGPFVAAPFEAARFEAAPFEAAPREPSPVFIEDEMCPELIRLLKSEALLLLEHGKHSHCAECCPNNYTPNILHLDISDIKYQSEELAEITLKSFVSVNRGLRALKISWTCLSNELIDFVAVNSPDLHVLGVQQCTSLSTPFLESFRNHNLSYLNTLGVSWLHDSDVVSIITPPSNLTSLNLAESNVADVGLIYLAKYTRLKHLNLSWCDDVTDTGLSTLISAAAPFLQALQIRQCSFGEETFKALPKCIHLTELDISAQVEINEEIWRPLATSLTLLEILDISWIFGMSDDKLELLLQNCRYLVKLCVDGHKEITTDCFKRMIVDVPHYKPYQIRSAQYAPQLQFASLQYCNDIDDDGMYEIVQMCRGSFVVKNYYGDDITWSHSET